MGECGKKSSGGDVMMHCEKCDFDLCQECHEHLCRDAAEAAELARERAREEALSADERELREVEALITQLHFSRSRGRLGHIAMDEESSDVESGCSSSTIWSVQRGWVGDESTLNSPRVREIAQLLK